MKVENPNQVVGKPVAQASAPLSPAPAAPVHQSSPARFHHRSRYHGATLHNGIDSRENHLSRIDPLSR
jgi:hypothetical protein